MAAKQQTYEQAKAQLDEIVEKLSAGNLPLDEMVKLYEKGAALCEACRKILESYEGRLDMVDQGEPEEA